MSLYQSFCDNLAILQVKQPKYVELLGSELDGPKHEPIVSLGDKMLKSLLKLAKKGESFFTNVPAEYINKLIQSIQMYQDLIEPRKIFGGLCPCLKPPRKGPEYDRKYCWTTAHIVTSIFFPIAILADNKAESLNFESVRYSDYIIKMNDLFKILNKINNKSNEAATREKVKIELLNAVDSVDRFVKFYFENNEDVFKKEVKRRLKSIKELLEPIASNVDGTPASSSKVPLGRRVIVKAQSSLQEIMNSAAAIALSKAKDSLYSLDDLTKILKRYRDDELSSFNTLEDEINNKEFRNDLHRLREDSEIVYNDASSKMRDALKRWQSVKKESFSRPVASLEEPNTNNQSNNGLISPDPSKIGKNVAKFAGKSGEVVGDVANGVTDAFRTVAGDFTQLTGAGFNIASSGASNVMNAGVGVVNMPAKMAKGILGFEDKQPEQPKEKNALSKAANFLGFEDSSPPPKNSGMKLPKLGL